MRLMKSQEFTIILMNVLHKLTWSATHDCHCTRNSENMPYLCFGKMCRSACFVLSALLGLKSTGLGFLATTLLVIVLQYTTSHPFTDQFLKNVVFPSEQPPSKTLINGFGQTNHCHRHPCLPNHASTIKHTSRVRLTALR